MGKKKSIEHYFLTDPRNSLPQSYTQLQRLLSTKSNLVEYKLGVRKMSTSYHRLKVATHRPILLPNYFSTF